MRPRTPAAGLAVAVVTASAFLTVGTAVAATVATGTDLYVDNSAAAHCSNQTTDSASTPYCTIQAAVNAASAGDTVQVKGGDSFTGETDVTTSGTSSAPITIESSGGTATINATGDQYGFYLNGVQYVDLSGLRMVDAGADVQASSSQHIGISKMDLIGSASTSNGVSFFQTSDSQVSTSYFQGAFGSSAAINVYGGGAAGPWQSSVDFTNSQAHGTVQLISDLYGFYGAN
jgi:hypothetical protein